MPKYEYECSSCEKRKVVSHSPHRRIKDCPFCESENTMKMVFNPPHVVSSGRVDEEQKEQPTDRISVERRLTEHMDEARNDLDELKDVYKDRMFEK